MATHSSVLPWRIPGVGEPGGLPSMSWACCTELGMTEAMQQQQQQQQPKNWSFSFNISPSKEYSGLISFRIHWFDLLAVRRTLKNFFQHHSLKVSIVWCSAFFMVQLIYPYMTTGKSIALTIQIFVGTVMTLLFNTLSRFAIAFLPGSELLFMAAVTIHSDFGAQANKVCHCFHFPPSVYHEVMRLDAMILVF